MADPRARVILEAIRRGDAAFASFQKDLGAIATRAKIVSAAAAAALAIVTKQSFSSIDALAKTSDLLGANTERLAALQLAANLTGNETRNLNLGLQRMARRVAEAAQGTGEARQAIKELGLDARELTRLPLEQQFERVAQAMQNVEGQSNRVRLGFKLFDSEGVALLRTANLVASEGLAGITEEAERLGIAVTRVDAAKIEAANDAILRAQSRVRGVGNVIAVELAPVVTALANSFAGSGAGAEAMSQRVRAAVDAIAVGVGLVADAFFGWKLLFGELRVAALGLAEFQIRQLRKLETVSIEVGNVFRRLFGTEEVDFRTGVFAEIEDSLGQSRVEAENAVAALAAAVPPSERLAAALQQARLDAAEAARAAAELAQKAQEGTPTFGPTADQQAAQEAAAKAEQQERERLARELEIVRQATLTREEAEIEATTRRLTILATAHEEGLLATERYYELLREVTARGEQNVAAIREAALSEEDKFVREAQKDRLGATLQFIQDTTAASATGNKRVFELNKVAAIANAVLDSREAILGAYKVGARIGGPILGAAFAATAAAATIAHVQAIRATQFGGGTTPSAAGSTPTLNGQPIPPQEPSGGPESARGPTVVQINVVGGVIDNAGTVRALAEQIAEIVENGDVQIVSPRSRNGQDLIEASA